MKKQNHLKKKLNPMKVIAMLSLAWMALCLPVSNAAAQASNNAEQQQGAGKADNISRSQLLAMPYNQMQEKLSANDALNITDLVNATPARLSQRQENLIYMTVDQFRQADAERKMHVIQNGANYIIVREASMIPKIQVSSAFLNSLPASKKQDILDSGDYIIID